MNTHKHKLPINTNKKLKRERLQGVQGQLGTQTEALSQRVIFPGSFIMALFNRVNIAYCGTS